MDKEKLLQVFKESYENKDKVNKDKLTKLIAETTPFINTLEKDLDYYKILYYRLALVLELDLDVRGIDKFTEGEQFVIGRNLPKDLEELKLFYDDYMSGEDSKEIFRDLLESGRFQADLAINTKEIAVLKYLEYYIELLGIAYA